MYRKDTPLDSPSSEPKQTAEEPSQNSDALTQKLEQGLGYYKIRKFGRAIACFRELVKNLKYLDEGKQQILAKALQSTTTGCLNKKKYRKAIKSAKLTIRVLHYIARNAPETEAELRPAQQKLLAALQGYLKYTIDQHRILITQELNRGNLLKGSLIQMCREGLNLLNKPLSTTDCDHNKVKNTRTKQTFNETLKELLEWVLKEELACYEDKNYLEALIYSKIATGPLREALSHSLTNSEKEKAILVKLTESQHELETRLNTEAAEALQNGLASALKAELPKDSDDFANLLENARKYLKDAVKKYNYLENHEKMLEAQQHFKNTSALQEKLSSSQPSLSHASFLAQNLSGGSKGIKHSRALEEKQQLPPTTADQNQNPAIAPKK